MGNTDWNILVRGYLSLIWCQKCVDSKNSKKCVAELLEEFEHKYEGVSPLNIGTLISASYICLMYPQQTEFEEMDFATIDIGSFNVTVGNAPDSKYLCRRIRNSLAHARFTINSSDDIIIFRDQKPEGTDKFEAKISISKYGDFLNEFFFCAKEQFFKRKA